MYTSFIGKKFLEYFKEEYNKPADYTAEQFFDEEMFPVFFDDERHLMSVKGSPFFQMNAIDGTRRKRFINNGLGDDNYISVKEDPVFRINAKETLKEKIKNKELGVHTFVGYGEMNPDAYTSGQITSINFDYTTEDYYYSWIGQALAIGSSSINILLDEKQILLQIFRGWKYYRLFMSQNPNLKENQINYWNGNWFNLSFNNTYDINYSHLNTELKGDILSIKSINWVQLIFVLCKNFKRKFLLALIYAIGDRTNTTIGFINIYLKDIDKIYEVRDLLFINEKETSLTDNQIESIMPFYTFKEACKSGTIGLKSIEPKGLRQYIPKGTFTYAQGKELQINKEINFNIYKLWIMAMLNKKELLELSREFAKILSDTTGSQQKDNRGKTSSNQFTKELFECTSIKQFINKVDELVKDNDSETLRKIVEEVVLMPRDNFPLFITLIKFEYSILSKKE